MKGLTNNDLSPIIDDLTKCMQNPEETEETIQKLAGVVFVQIVDGAALSIIVPLIISGLRQKKAQIKRMCARIVANMTKLVEDPLEAEPFLEVLIPLINDAADTIPDPEARDVAYKTHQHLLNISKIAKETSNLKEFRKSDNILYFLNQNLNEKYHNSSIARYISEICASLIKTKTTEKEEYINEITPYLNFISDTSKRLDSLYEKSINIINISDDEDDSEDKDKELCNCEFTLAYGTKVLLHNTKLRLLKGKKYGLVGQNDSGKTTLMRAIADGSIDGFPDASEVKTVLVIFKENCPIYII